MRTKPIRLHEREVFLLGTVFAVSMLFVFAGPPLAPFLLALLMASALSPLMDLLMQTGMKRLWAALVLTALCYIILALALWFSLPPLWHQLESFIQHIPELLQKFNKLTEKYIDIGFDVSFDDMKDQAVDKIQNDGLSSVVGPTGSMMDIFGSITGSATSAALLIGLTPFITFYYLHDGPRIVVRMVGLLPEERRPDLIHLWTSIKKRLVGYMRGQALLSTAEAAIYSTGLLIVGLDYAIIIGVATGIMSIIPVVGKLIMITIAIGIGFSQFDNMAPFIGILITYGIVEILEGTILAPKLVGDQIRLHPLLVIAALLVGSYLFGFMGALLALPGAAVFSAFMEELMTPPALQK